MSLKAAVSAYNRPIREHSVKPKVQTSLMLRFLPIMLASTAADTRIDSGVHRKLRAGPWTEYLGGLLCFLSYSTLSIPFRRLPKVAANKNSVGSLWIFRTP